MTGYQGPDTMHDQLDDLLDPLPPVRPLPEGFAARARRRRAGRAAGATLALVVVVAGGGLALAHTLPGTNGQATVRAPVTGRHTARQHRPAATPTVAPSRSATVQQHSDPVLPAACTAGDLTLRVGPGGGTAGSTYYPLRFTNESAHPCSLTGYPGVSFVTGTGHQVGQAATRNPVSPPRTLTLHSGATVAAALQVGDAANYPPSSCRPVPVTRLRVYPPGSYSALEVAFAATACSGPVHQLSVSVVLDNSSGTP